MLAGPKGESFVSEARITHQETGMVPGVSVGNSDHRGGSPMRVFLVCVCCQIGVYIDICTSTNI